MDTLCGIGLPELVIITLFSFVIIGPERSREIGLTVGRWLRRAVKSQWWREFNQMASSIRDLPNTLIRMSELEDDLQRVKRDLNRATKIDPPAGALSDSTSAPPRAPDSNADPWGIHAATPPSPPGDSRIDE